MEIFAETAVVRSGHEITKHCPLADPQRVQWALERLRGQGALIAVDDAGSGYAGLQQILTLRPNILKLDRVRGAATLHGSSNCSPSSTPSFSSRPCSIFAHDEAHHVVVEMTTTGLPACSRSNR